MTRTKKSNNTILTKSLPLIIFAAAMIFHAILSVYMSKAYNGIEQLDRYGGLLYRPATLLLRTPQSQYTAMLLINSVLIALIPVTAFRITEHIGINPLWQRLFITLVTAIYPAVILNTKSIETDLSGNQTITLLFPFVMAFAIIICCVRKSVLFRHITAVLSAAFTVITLFIGNAPATVAVTVSVLITLIIALILLRRKTIPLLTYTAAFVALYLICDYLLAKLSISHNEIHAPISKLHALIREANLNNLNNNGENRFKLLIQYIYEFAVSTWGLGIIGRYRFVGMFTQFSQKNVQKLNKKSHAETYMVIFTSFVFTSFITALIISLLTKQNCVTGGITLLMLFSSLCAIAVRGLNLQTILNSTMTMGAIFTSYFILYNNSADFITVSLVFSFMATLIVIICCSNRYRAHLLTSAISIAAIVMCVYSTAITLPKQRKDIIANNKPVLQAADLIHNSKDAPPVIVENDVSARTTALLKFLNQEAKVITAEELTQRNEDLPENYLCIMPIALNVTAAEEREHLLFLGETKRYKVYAFGEKAVKYVESQS